VRGPYVKRLYDNLQSFDTEFNCAVALGPVLIALRKQVGPIPEETEPQWRGVSGWIT